MHIIDISSVVIQNIDYLITIHLKQGDTRQQVNRATNGIIFVSTGKLVYEIHGKRHISDPGHALILPQGSTYAITSIDASVSLLINFQADPLFDKNDLINFTLSNSQWFLNYFYQLDNLWTFKKTSYLLRCMAGLYEILAKLNEYSAFSYNLNYKFDYIKPSIDFLEANYTNPNLNNDLLAEKSRISTVYFRKIFTEKYKVSPMKYLMIKRIEKAQDMLKGKYSSITSVAEATGFNNICHFSRAFKSVTGYTPFEYFRSYANGEELIRLP